MAASEHWARSLTASSRVLASRARVSTSPGASAGRSQQFLYSAGLAGELVDPSPDLGVWLTGSRSIRAVCAGRLDSATFLGNRRCWRIAGGIGDARWADA